MTTSAAAPAPAPHFEPVRVLDAWDETAHLRGVRLDLGPLAALQTAPGQVLKLRAPSGEGYFALATRPGDPHAEILLKRGAHVADELVAAAEEGAKLLSTAPMGRGFPVAEMVGRDVLLFAAGSGISPIRGLLRHILHVRGEMGRVVLFYGQRFVTEFAFAEDRKDWERGGVEVTLCCSQATGAWHGAKGRVQEVGEGATWGGLAPQNTVVFLCGMKGMVEGVRERLGVAGIPPERTFLNY